MHVLPLPFGLALALIPRREAEKLRDDGQEPHQYEKTFTPASAPRRHPVLHAGRRSL